MGKGSSHIGINVPKYHLTRVLYLNRLRIKEFVKLRIETHKLLTHSEVFGVRSKFESEKGELKKCVGSSFVYNLFEIER